MFSKRLLSCVLLLKCFVLGGSFAGDIIVVLKNSSTVERRSASTGQYLGPIMVTNAERASTDGEIIAVQLSNGTIRRHSAENGHFLGSINNVPKGSGEITGLNVSGGVIVVVVGRTAHRYDAKTGAYKGPAGM